MNVTTGFFVIFIATDWLKVKLYGRPPFIPGEKNRLKDVTSRVELNVSDTGYLESDGMVKSLVRV